MARIIEITNPSTDILQESDLRLGQLVEIVGADEVYIVSWVAMANDQTGEARLVSLTGGMLWSFTSGFGTAQFREFSGTITLGNG